MITGGKKGLGKEMQCRGGFFNRGDKELLFLNLNKKQALGCGSGLFDLFYAHWTSCIFFG